MHPARSLALALVLISPALAQNPAPTNLVASSPPVSPPKVQLKWTASTNAAFFKIYRSEEDTLHFRWINVASASPYEDPTVGPPHLYFYYVTAVTFVDSTLHESARSNIARIDLAGPPPGPHGVFAGVVKDEVTAVPLPHVQIRFLRLANFPTQLFAVFSDSLGRYRVQIDTGTFILRAEPEPPAPSVSVSGYRGEWYENAEEPDHATPVHVNTGDSVNIDFGLAKLTQPNFCFINGRVTDSTGAPLTGALVAILRSFQSMNSLAAAGNPPGLGAEADKIPGLGYVRGIVWKGFTNTSGEYHGGVIIGGSYIVMAWKEGFLPRFYRNTADPTRAEVLVAHGDTSGINITLPARIPYPGSLEGTIRDSSGGGVPARVILFPRPGGGSGAEEGSYVVFSNEEGVYQIPNVPAGTYYLQALPYSDYAPAFYRSNTFGTVSWEDADTLVVAATPAGSFTIGAAPLVATGAARIAGTVTVAGDGPIPGARVTAWADGKIISYGFADQTGRYVIEDLNAGNLFVAVDRPGFAKFQQQLAIPSAVTHIDNVNYSLNVWGVPTDGGPILRLIPGKPKLNQNYPNPFNPTTAVSYQLPALSGVEGSAASKTKIAVYDMLGREVAVLVDGVQAPGEYTVTWDARGFASGVYVCRLIVGTTFTEMRKMVLVR
jgi:hypothetical protein